MHIAGRVVLALWLFPVVYLVIQSWKDKNRLSTLAPGDA
jgi:hypothetical protein